VRRTRTRRTPGRASAVERFPGQSCIDGAERRRTANHQERVNVARRDPRAAQTEGSYGLSELFVVRFECPKCGAAASKPCLGRGGRYERITPHSNRRSVAETDDRADLFQAVLDPPAESASAKLSEARKDSPPGSHPRASAPGGADRRRWAALRPLPSSRNGASRPPLRGLRARGKRLMAVPATAGDVDGILRRSRWDRRQCFGWWRRRKA
jgi:hypothetical protein